jgi:DNA-directed RNA polymerase specialized sigma24 family protein
MKDKERSLLAGCLSGDKAAWDAFVLEYSPLVYHTIKKTLTSYHVEPRSHLVDDLFQDVFVALLRDDFRKLRQFRGERDIARSGCRIRLASC